MSPRPEKKIPAPVEEEPRRPKRSLSGDKRMRGKAPLPADANRPAAPPGNYVPLLGGFLLAVVFPFLAITMLIPQWTGAVGQSLEGWLFAVSGSTSLLVPLISLSFGLHFLLPRQRRPVQMTWAPILLWFNLVVLAQRMGSQGGSVGAWVDNALVALVGPVGSWLISLACLPLCVLAVCRVHPQEAGHALASFLHAVQDRLGELFLWLHGPAKVAAPHHDSMEESLEEVGPSAVEPPRLLSIEGPLLPKAPKAPKPMMPKTCVPSEEEEEDSWEGEERLPFELASPPSPAMAEEFPAIPKRALAPEKITFFPEGVSTPARTTVTPLEPLEPLEPVSALEPVQPPGAIPKTSALEPEASVQTEATHVKSTEGPTSIEVDSPGSVSLEAAPSAEASDEVEEADPTCLDLPAQKPRSSSAAVDPAYLEPNGQLRLFPGEVKPAPPPYKLPPLALLNDAPFNRDAGPPEDKSHFLLDALASFGVQASLLAIVRGPTVTRYELQPARGVKVSRFTSLTNDIALALAATAVRIEAPIPGKSAIGIEIPNAVTDLVVLKDILASSRFRKSTGLSIALGKDLGGNPTFTNLQKMPHLLVAGTTGSGKSVCVNGLILSLMYRFTPRQLQLLMIDPKQVELSIYEGIPHLISLSRTPESKNEGAIICDPKRAAMALHQIVELMEFRYGMFASARVRNLEEYNEAVEEALPWVVVIIDELADLMMVAAKTVETSICRIAQKARAAGIHLVLATQRPSADVITGLIKVNVPSRIAFAVSSQVDSRVILDTGGAEQLLGKGDMLFCPVDASDPRRLQGCYVTNEEILRVVEWWKAQSCPENLIRLQAQEVADEAGDDDEEDADDALVEQALGVIVRRQQASASLLQTELKVGYARARRLIYLMEKKGYIGPADGSKPRKILYPGGGRE